MATLLRPLIFGGLGGVAGYKIVQMVDITYKEEIVVSDTKVNIDPVRSGRAGEIMKFGVPKEAVTGPLVYKNHVLGYDGGRRVPRWVAEHLGRDKMGLEEVANRKGISFGPDPTVPVEFSSNNRDYWNSGWSRGHMAPAGNNKHCQESMNQTFLLTNVVPQDLDNNGNYWNRLEIYCRNLAKEYQDVWVTSGPLWLPATQEKNQDEGIKAVEQVENVEDINKPKKKVRPPRPPPKVISYQVIGDNNISVPTHLYKIVLVSDPSLSYPLIAAFIVPNTPVQDVPLTKFQVQIKDLERWTGLYFHPELNREQLGDLCLEKSCKMQNYKEFQQFFWKRRLTNPWNLRNLERDWAEACRKGVVGPELELVYNQSKTRLEDQIKPDDTVLAPQIRLEDKIKADDTVPAPQIRLEDKPKHESPAPAA